MLSTAPLHGKTKEGDWDWTPEAALRMNPRTRTTIHFFQ